MIPLVVPVAVCFLNSSSFQVSVLNTSPLACAHGPLPRSVAEVDRQPCTSGKDKRTCATDDVDLVCIEHILGRRFSSTSRSSSPPFRPERRWVAFVHGPMKHDNPSLKPPSSPKAGAASAK